MIPSTLARRVFILWALSAAWYFGTPSFDLQHLVDGTTIEDKECTRVAYELSYDLCMNDIKERRTHIL
jgi:hypothetical protein